MRLKPNFIFCISVSIFSTFYFVFTIGNSSKDSSRIANNDSRATQTFNVNTQPVMLGEIDTNRKYAVFSSTSNRNKQTYDFIFLLPLTAMAWKRVGFDSLVIIVGSVNAWTFDPLRHNVLSRLRQLNAVIMFLNVPPVNSVMVSQVRNTRFQTLFSLINVINVVYKKTSYRRRSCTSKTAKFTFSSDFVMYCFITTVPRALFVFTALHGM